jgi:hypothetical protein
VWRLRSELSFRRYFGKSGGWMRQGGYKRRLGPKEFFLLL